MIDREIRPRAVGRFEIGRSVEGRPIEALAFGDGPTLALVHGGIHGDEPDAPRAVDALAQRLAGRRSDAGPAQGARVVLVPAVNPDGLVAGRKDNARGVDLNRNFDAASFAALHKPGYDPGPRPLSEPESAALSALIARERPARLVAVHQPFACVNWDGPARDLAEAMARACGWPAVADLGYATPGSFGSRYGRDEGLEVITLELPRPADDGAIAAAVAALLVACAR